MYGKKHDIAKLRDARFKAVMNGMTYMRKFLQNDNYKALFAIGDDAPSIFFEIWYTSADSRIRARAQGIAKEMLNVFIRRLQKQLKNYSWKADREDFFEYMYLLRAMHEMDMDCSVLIEVADKCWKDLDLQDTDKLFEQTLEGNQSIKWVTTESWLMLLMKILIMEYNKLLFGNRWPIKWGMHEAMLVLKKHELVAPSKHHPKGSTQAGLFHDSIYLATHMVYALNAYQSIPTRESDCRWLYAFCRTSMRFWLKCDQRNRKAAKAGITERELVDIDGMAECVDVLRGCGQSEASDRLLTQGVLYLLKTQKPDGSWPAEFAGDRPNRLIKREFYDLIHPCWVATQALRDRDYKIERKGNVAWQKWIDKVVKATHFGELDYEPTWKVFDPAVPIPKRKPTKSKAKAKAKAEATSVPASLLEKSTDVTTKPEETYDSVDLMEPTSALSLECLHVVECSVECPVDSECLLDCPGHPE